MKNEVAETAHGYEVSVYTADTIKQARADRAKLNKFVDAINGKRAEIRKKLLKPDEQFGKEVFLRTYDIGQAMAERNRLEAAEQKRDVGRCQSTL
ncbi:MAG: DUF1351 domain-containing protein [Hungatella sp.]